MAEPPVWTFATAPVTPRHPQVLLVAFSTGPLADDVEMSVSRFGAPSIAAISDAEVRTIEARQDPRWFQGWRAGSLRAVAEGDLEGALGALDAADRIHMISVAPAAPTDLGYLQTAWALARFLVARGATTVLDVHAMTYRHGAAVAAAEAAFDVRREIRIIFETASERPDGAHALHTRGLRKFGAPDLVALCSDADVDVVGAVMTQIATALAGGAELRAGHHAIDLDQSMTWQVVDDEHGLAQLLQLNNDARVLVDDDGAHLTGIAARLRRALTRS
jgi:hypothetical protein